MPTDDPVVIDGRGAPACRAMGRAWWKRYGRLIVRAVPLPRVSKVTDEHGHVYESTLIDAIPVDAMISEYFEIVEREHGGRRERAR